MCREHYLDGELRSIVNGEIEKRFQELMNPGVRINSFIDGYTGITNGMLKRALPCKEVMHKFADFVDKS